MLQLKKRKGKLYGSNYSFAWPKRFNLEMGLDSFTNDELLFGYEDNDYLGIVIYFKEEGYSAKNDMQAMFDKNNRLIKLSNFISVKRGKGVGVGIFYENLFGATQHYGERYAFKKNACGETEIFIDIFLWSGSDKDRLTIQEVLEYPEVKAFLKSIEYF